MVYTVGPILVPLIEGFTCQNVQALYRPKGRATQRKNY